MDFMIEQDIESVLEITGFTIEELAEDLCVSRITVKYSLQGTTQGNGLTGGLPPVRFSM